MLFHIKQSHAPQDCPYGKGGSKSLFDEGHLYVQIRGDWPAFPQHTTFLVVETDDIRHLHEFLKPGAGVTTSEITPVSDQPVPPPEGVEPHADAVETSGRPHQTRMRLRSAACSSNPSPR